MSGSIVHAKSKAFAIRIVSLYKFLCETQSEYVLSKQLLRSGTSVGANISEATFASSKKDFLNKTFIAQKECAETAYWLELLKECGYLSLSQYESINEDCQELLKMLCSITKTTSKNINK